MRSAIRFAAAALVAAMASGSPASAQQTPYEIIEPAIDLVLDGQKDHAMVLARRVAAACEAPDAPLSDCEHAMLMASELARMTGDDDLAQQWAAASTGFATRRAGAGSTSEAAALAFEASRLRALYRFSEAIDASERALTIFERERGIDHPNTDTARQELAWAYLQQGRLDMAEYHLRLVFEHVRARDGEGAFTTGMALADLGQVYYQQNRQSLADQAFRQAMDIMRGEDELQSLRYHSAQLSLGMTLHDRGDPLQAEALIRAAIDSGQLNIDRPARFAANDALVEVLLESGRAAEARALAQRNLRRAGQEAEVGPASLARYTVTLAQTTAASGDLAEADTLYTQAIATLLVTLGSEHPATIYALHAQAQLRRRMGRPADEAVSLLQQASQGAIAAATRSALNPQAAAGLRDFEVVFTDYLDALYTSDGPGRSEAGFAMLQWAMTTDAALALSRVAAQRATSGDAVGVLEAEQVRLTADRTAMVAVYEQMQLAAAADPAERQAMIARLSALEADLLRVDRAIEQADPTYNQVSRARVASLAGLQQALGRDEAVLLVLPTSGGTHTMLVRTDSAAWHHDAGLTDVEVAGQVSMLRAAVQEDLAYEEVTYPYAQAAALQRSLFGPVEQALAGVSQLYIATDGRLATLPFAMLPDAAVEDRWLADRFALVNLPSLAAFATNRAAVAAQQAGSDGPALAGIGAPALAGGGAATRSAEGASYDAAFAAGQRSAAAAGRPLADPAYLRSLEPLPGSAAELRQIGAMFPQGQAVLRLGAEAVEPAVRDAVEVAAADVLVFSTHGLLAAESLVGEPGLVLTPPMVSAASASDDGLLGASEVAQMRLAARLVVLSACNTGTPGGRGAAGGLSALARAFLAAGPGQVVASHWQVSDEATAALMTALVRSWQANPQQPAARHLAAAMREVRAQPQWHSPAFWAAFSIYADGE